MQFSVSFKRNMAKQVKEVIETQSEEIAEDAVENRLFAIANDAIKWSPVWSGAYVNSFGFTSPSGGGRTRSRVGNYERRVNESTAKGQAESNLYTDIRSIMANFNLEDGFRLTLINRAPHASKVEYGPSPGDSGPYTAYNVFGQLRARYG